MQNQEAAVPKKKSRGTFTVLTSSIAGAVIGSMLTMYGAPVLQANSNISSLLEAAHIKLPAAASDAAATQTEAKQEAVPATNSVQKEVTVQQTAAAASNLVDVIENIKPAVVGVVSMKKSTGFYQDSTSTEDSGTGSGVVFKVDGSQAYIVTNNHVIEGADQVEIALTDGKRVAAQVVGADSLTDLAVLKMDSQYASKTASFGDSSKLRVGEQVAAIGNPLGLDLSSTVTQGIVSGTGRSIPVSTSAGEWDMNVIQTDAAINPGNSGGALINSAGQVVGINSMKISETGVEGLGFAIPSQDAVPIIEELMQDGKVQRPYIGVGLKNLGELTAYVQNGELQVPAGLTEGVVITKVEANSPGAAAGLQAKDVIVSINKTKVKTVAELRKYLYTQTEANKAVSVELYRNGQAMTVSLTAVMK